MVIWGRNFRHKQTPTYFANTDLAITYLANTDLLRFVKLLLTVGYGHLGTKLPTQANTFTVLARETRAACC